MVCTLIDKTPPLTSLGIPLERGEFTYFLLLLFHLNFITIVYLYIFYIWDFPPPPFMKAYFLRIIYK